MINAARIIKKTSSRTIIAIVLGFLVSGLILLIMGYDPVESLVVLFESIFSRPKYFVNVIIKSTPIILTGLSVAFAFKTGLFNIGAEGQYIAATIASATVGIMLDLHPVLQIPIVVFAGVLAGAFWGAIVGYLKAKFGIHEVIVSIMLNWIALYLCNFVANSHRFHKPNSDGTFPINSSGLTTILGKWKFSGEGRAFLKGKPLLSEILLQTDLNIGFIVAILTAIIVWVVLFKTTKGYELRVVGSNPCAAENAGINVSRSIMFSMLTAGALSGLAGALSVTGMSFHNLHSLAVFENYGFNGLAVALIAGSSPFGCIFSGLIFSGLIYGGQSLQLKTGAPSEIINITIGIIVLFVALSNYIPKLVDKFMKRRGTEC